MDGRERPQDVGKTLIGAPDSEDTTPAASTKCEGGDPRGSPFAFIGIGERLNTRWYGAGRQDDVGGWRRPWTAESELGQNLQLYAVKPS